MRVIIHVVHLHMFICLSSSSILCQPTIFFNLYLGYITIVYFPVFQKDVLNSGQLIDQSKRQGEQVSALSGS